jgi:excinuclease ABC subunit A
MARTTPRAPAAAPGSPARLAETTPHRAVASAGPFPKPAEAIVVRGAREHNLKNIDVTLPRDRLNVITGLSGSGKSSLAFDTLYAEGQRRYVESLSAYARQFLGQMEKPELDSIEGLSPAISIDQKTTSKNPRSTVGTITEVYDYLRVLYANLGEPHCPNCHIPIQRQTPQEIVDRLVEYADGTKLQILAPVVKDRKGEYRKLFTDFKQQGFLRVRVDGKMGTVDDSWEMGRYDKHTIEIVVDRIVLGPATRGRLAEAVETALKHGEGVVNVLVATAKGDDARAFSEQFACVRCGFSMPEIAPRSFSFNNPHGACPGCSGLGFSMEPDPSVLVTDPEKPIVEALNPVVRRASPWIGHEISSLARSFRFKAETPWNKLPESAKKLLLYGSDRDVKFRYEASSGTVWESYDTFEGIVTRLARYYKETDSESKREAIQSLMSQRPCQTCGGARLKREILAVTVNGKNIAELTAQSADQLYAWFSTYEAKLDERQRKIAHEVVKEIRERLRFMVDVGLDYLTLDRSAATLSGGEAQRIRLATQIGSRLVGVLYILDEPSIGLHPRDNRRLIDSLKGLRDLGNTLVVVEHDEEMIRSADWVLDLGPGAGEHGGRLIAAGTPEDIEHDPQSLTGAYLSGRRTIPTPAPAKRRPGNGKRLVVRGARENNLKEIDVPIPLGMLVCVTGVSGSGKSTLVNDVLYKSLARHFYHATESPGAHRAIDGLSDIDKAIIIDQSPIGRTPRSVPATYTGVFTPIRDLFAELPEAKIRGYDRGRFSFNVPGKGRCAACEGDGMVQIEMHFLADVYVPCEVCKGARYDRETLQVTYKGKTIKDVLDMTVDDALEFFKDHPGIRRSLETLHDVGLGYMRIGQSSTTLSGGEAQRVKLATELQKRATGKTLYILDEPTTGLHFEDIKKLLGVLDRLVESGNTVLVIEHNLDVIKCADWIVDLGPEGGAKGGELVAQGTPEAIARTSTYTGQWLRAHMESERARARSAGASAPREGHARAESGSTPANAASGNGNGNGSARVARAERAVHPTRSA